MNAALDITREQRKTLLELLGQFIPGVLVCAYGSRAKWTARPNSDLDLVVFATGAQKPLVSELKDALAESDLPYLVDLHIWDEIPERFHRIIRDEFVVLQPAEENRPRGEPPGGWKERTLGELTENFDGRRVPVKESERKPGIYPYYGASGIVDHIDNHIFDGEYLLVAEDGENLRTQKTPVAFLARGKFWVNNHAHVVTANSQSDTRFLMYALNNAAIQGFLTGSTMPKLTQGNLNRIPILAPPPEEQHAIASVLGALDDKIELNRRMNKTLEALVQHIFKSWILDPAAVKLPKGWGESTIRDLASNIQYGLTRSASSEPVGPRFLRITDIQGGIVDWGSVPFCKVSGDELDRYRLKPRDVMVARTGASTGENIYLPVVPDAVFASYLVRFQFAVPAMARLVGAFMRTPAYVDYVAGCVGGSAQPNASAQVLAGAKLPVPGPELARKFAETVAPLDKRIGTNNEESHTLAELRDALLPKLLSGELRAPSVRARKVAK